MIIFIYFIKKGNIMPNQADYDYFLKGDPEEVRLQLIEVTHPSWINDYRYVQNSVNGVTVTHEDGTQADYTYSPITIKKGKADDDLDQSITIGVADLGELLPFDIDRLRSGNHANVKPILNYREYLMSDLTKPVVSVLGLEVSDWQPNKEGSVFVCKAKEMNLTKTGIAYTLDKFPLLRGFL